MKDIKNFEGLYAVTSCGKIWSYRNNKFLAPRLVNGYSQVCLQKNSKRYNYLVHRLVAETYIPNLNSYREINHIDEDKANNSVNNLEWCTHEYNLNYGTRNARSKRTVYCVELDKTFSGLIDAAQALNISVGNISTCCRNPKRTTGGYHWKYV